MTLLSTIRSIALWSLSIFLMTAWVPFLGCVWLVDRDPLKRRTGRWFRRLGVALSHLHGARIEVERPSAVDPARTYVVVSNHGSLADIPVLCHLPWEMKWLAKAELFRVPVIGWMMRLAGDIPVQRDDRARATAALREAGRTLKAGCSLMVFPEGTRSRDGEVGPFTSGAFHLARRAGVPVLPVAIEGSAQCLPQGSWRFGPAASVRVRVFPPVEPSKTAGDADALRDHVRQLIVGQLAEWRGDAAPPPLPRLIQGGMGIAVSSYRLARTVSSLGQLGVVSGTALDIVLTRRLQLGDPTGELRRALAAFPDPRVTRRLLDDYFVPGGKAPDAPFKPLPMYAAAPSPARHEAAMLGGFVEVWLAKEGHRGVVGINFLHKIQIPTPATLYGALLAGVDYVLVGAGIPRDIPALLERLCRNEPARVALQVTGGGEERFEMTFDPRVALPAPPPPRDLPRFLPIVASATLAQALARRGAGIDGFVVEGPTAGGHNAPPRGAPTLSPDGEPVYGPRDVVDLAKMRSLGLPFWLAGACASPERLQAALAEGAAGVQVGSAFAFCEESGLDPFLRDRVIGGLRNGGIRVVTDPQASPTGFPFKVIQLEGTLSEAAVYGARERRCDLGYLREMYLRDDGTLGYRCPAEPSDDYVRKGGRREDTAGRKCICNGLVAGAGLAQRGGGGTEAPILTAGSELEEVRRLLNGGRTYTAAAVVSHVTSGG